MHYCFMGSGNWRQVHCYVRMRRLGAELIQKGARVSYVIEDYADNRSGLDFHPKSEIHYIPLGNPIKQALARRRILKRLNPDVLHIHTPHIKNYFALAGSSRYRIVGDWDEPPVFKEYPWLRMQMERYLDRWQRKKSWMILVASRHLEKWFRDSFGIETVYIPHATDLPLGGDGPSPYSKPTAVYMGSMYPQWDMDLMFDALAMLAEDGFKPPVALVGDGPDR
ncbi:MAG: glycosyltransferase, partial [Tepidisphaeraceae bacterium]